MLNLDNIVISKVIKIKTFSKYLIEYLDIAVRPIFLIIPKISKYVKKFNVNSGDKNKNNKMMPFRAVDEKLLEKYKLFRLRLKTQKILN